MFATDQYQLLDFGAGRKLERFGAVVLERPSPAAGGMAKRAAEMWEQADARYERGEGGQGRWKFNRTLPPTWRVQSRDATFGLKFSQFGQVGLFPEQAENWDWLANQLRSAGRPSKVLNLFAYTGGSTLAAAAVGAEVTHVDAATPVVTWARQNAQASGFSDAPIHWIVEDALKFARRELKRGNRYDAVILDPPAYGHGPGGELWKIDEHLGELLSLCLKLTSWERQFLLLTCHSGQLDNPSGLLKYAIERAPEIRDGGRLEASEISLVSSRGNRLRSGAAVRWTSGEKSGRRTARDGQTRNRMDRGR